MLCEANRMAEGKKNKKQQKHGLSEETFYFFSYIWKFEDSAYSKYPQGSNKLTFC